MPLINFSGIASGIDSNALIDAFKAAARTQRVEPKEEKISELEDTNTALTELKSQLNKLKDLARGFSSLNSGGVVKLGKSTDETIATATASSSANNGSYSLNVTQLAKNATYGFKSSAGTYTTADAVIGSTIVGTGTVAVTIGQSPEDQTVNVDVDNTTTLSEFVTEFNSETSKAVASVINAGTSLNPDYRIVITTNNEGELKGDLSVVVGGVITAANAFNQNSLSEAKNALFTISGIGSGSGDTITRFSNTFSDVVPGLSITLQATGSATITVGDDAAATSSKVQEFIDTFNEMVAFIKENDLVTREEDGENVDSIFGPLASSQLDEGVLTQIRANISSSTYSSGDAVRIFADLGVTTERDGTLKFDASVLEDAIGDEASSVKQILQNFGDLAGVTGGSIDQYVRFNGLIDIAINGNTDQITSLNDQISRAEASIAKEEETMRLRFARLEGLIGQLQNQQSALTSALAGLQR